MIHKTCFALLCLCRHWKRPFRCCHGAFTVFIFVQTLCCVFFLSSIHSSISFYIITFGSCVCYFSSSPSSFVHFSSSLLFDSFCYRTISHCVYISILSSLLFIRIFYLFFEWLSVYECVRERFILRLLYILSFDSGSHDKMKQKKEKRDEHVEDKRPATHLNERFRYCDRVHLSTPI